LPRQGFLDEKLCISDRISAAVALGVCGRFWVWYFFKRGIFSMLIPKLEILNCGNCGNCGTWGNCGIVESFKNSGFQNLKAFQRLRPRQPGAHHPVVLEQLLRSHVFSLAGSAVWWSAIRWVLEIVEIAGNCGMCSQLWNCGIYVRFTAKNWSVSGMTSMISIDAFSKLRFQKWAPWSNGIVWHTVPDPWLFIGDGILVRKLWNRNCGISQKSKIMYFPEILEYLTKTGNTIVNAQSYLAPLEKRVTCNPQVNPRMVFLF